MTWLPHFLNWPIALGVAGAAIPALLVLYFLKLRRREMAVSSTILWRKAIQDLQVNAPFQKLRRNLLLLLQLLLLLFLLLALSRPVANYTPGPGKTTVILIDRSASMACKDVNGHSRLDEAKKRALDLVAGMKRDATAMVIAFDDSAEMLQAFTSDQNLLRNAVDSIKQTDRKTDLRLAYQLADAQSANYNPEQLRPNTDAADIVLYSDGRVLNENDLTVRGNVTYEKLGDDKSGNVGIVSLSSPAWPTSAPTRSRPACNSAWTASASTPKSASSRTPSSFPNAGPKTNAPSTRKRAARNAARASSSS
jgi:hypothetical protein